ncbi:hypothetical protein [Primorskyibacter sp. S187A]|uniref:hypothetical protein n=1 Tax=Primorskyibacter sp. S187A TaxID=3415130 RepID=UPI003C7EB821
MILSIAKRPLLIASFGAILVSISEFWFYQVDEEVSHVGILLAYGLLGYLFLVVVERFKVRDGAALFVAAAMLGYLIEGVPVPVMYSGPPFTIVWTSLAWHALITVGIGWIVFKQVMTHGGILRVILFNAAFGAFLGLWNSYMWHALENDATGEVRFEWAPVQPFIDQFLIGYGLFLAGHLVFERVWSPSEGLTKGEHYGLWILAALFAALTGLASGLWFFFPVLPVMVLICLWALKRNARADLPFAGSKVAALAERPIPLWRYVFTLLIPLCAIGTYVTMVEAQIGLEMNAFVIITAGPISLGLFLWGLWRCARAMRRSGNA